MPQQSNPPKENSKQLAECIRNARLENKQSIVHVAAACKISKQYLCDLEHGRRGLRMDMRIAAKLAACLNIPISEITDRVEHLTHKEQRNYAAYHRVLRSNVRAGQALSHMTQLRDLSGRLRIANKNGQDVSKLLQQLETTVESLDATLAYKAEHLKGWRKFDGDDAKFGPGRR